MKLLKNLSALRFAVLAMCVLPLGAAPVSSCAGDGSVCNVFEGQPLTYPAGITAISGDTVVIDPMGATTGVFRIFNDLFDTGSGTGIGDMAFLYGADLADLPDPSTYSANVQFIPLGTTGPAGYYETSFNGNGTEYNLFTPSPEPASLAFIAIGVLGFGVLSRRRLQH